MKCQIGVPGGHTCHSSQSSSMPRGLITPSPWITRVNKSYKHGYQERRMVDFRYQPQSRGRSLRDIIVSNVCDHSSSGFFSSNPRSTSSNFTPWWAFLEQRSIDIDDEHDYNIQMVENAGHRIKSRALRTNGMRTTIYVSLLVLIQRRFSLCNASPLAF